MNQHEIRTRRKALGLTVQKLAAYLGVSQQHLSNLEGGKNANPDKLEEINTVLSKLEAVAQLTANVVTVKERSKAVKNNAPVC